MKKINPYLVLVITLLAISIIGIVTTPEKQKPSLLAGSSIQAAINSANSGDTIHIASGTYNETVAISKSGITLVCNGTCNTKQIYVTGNNNVVRGFTVTDPTSDSGLRVSGNGNLFEGNDVSHTKQDGVWFWGHDNTFRNNYIHDILDPSAASTNNGDPHVDCFQTWDWSWDTYNVLFDGNICNHTRTSQSNQIVMLSGSAHDLTFRNNRFIMADSGYSPLALYGGTGFTIDNNYFCNSTGKGGEAVYLDGGKNVTLTNNTWIGYSALVSGSGVAVNSGNTKGALPCQITENTTGTPIVTNTPISSTATPTKTPTTVTPTWTNTPVITATYTATRTPTKTATLTNTITLTPTVTITKVSTMTFTPTLKPLTITPTVTPTPAPMCKWLGWARFWEWWHCRFG